MYICVGAPVLFLFMYYCIQICSELLLYIFCMLPRRAEWCLFPIVFSKNVLAFSALFYTPCGWITIHRRWNTPQQKKSSLTSFLCKCFYIITIMLKTWQDPWPVFYVNRMWFFVVPFGGGGTMKYFKPFLWVAILFPPNCPKHCLWDLTKGSRAQFVIFLPYPPPPPPCGHESLWGIHFTSSVP
jgi:hypothetical protein